MNTQTVAGSAAELMRAEAELIIERGWSTSVLPNTGLDLEHGACWAITGKPCHPSDLTDQQFDVFAAYMATLEDCLGMTAAEYQKTHSGSRTIDVAFDLEGAAWELEREDVRSGV